LPLFFSSSFHSRKLWQFLLAQPSFALLTMLENLDAATDAALQSFSEALAEAQRTLQQDQAHLDRTACLLRELSGNNNALRTGKVHNMQELQRLEALRAEKAKLIRQTEHKRDNVQSCVLHMQQLKQPRLQLISEVERRRREVKALRQQYCTRAAQVHGYVAQFLDPQNSLVNLRSQLVRMQHQRKEGEAAVQQLKERLLELQKAAAELNGEKQSELLTNEYELACRPEAQERNHGGHGDSPPAPLDTAAREAEEDADSAAIVTAGCATKEATEAERLAALTAQRAEQQTAFASAQCQYTQEETVLQQRREELKQRVLQLCGEIEEADAAQQAEQKSYHDRLNAAASSAISRVCVCCCGDLLFGFA
jgi:uncharacterized coiled-coil protein SlyX